MSSKVLVADDSLTIQKVVSITLSGDEFTLIECLNENDLIAKVSSQEFDLILIDFNLSDSRTGYQLCKEVSSISQNTPILAMLGTFDSIQDGELQDAGVEDKIVKPFESEKFIKKCRELIAGAQSLESSEDFSDDESDETEDQEGPGSSDEHEQDNDQWVVDTPGVDFEVREELEDSMPEEAASPHTQEQTVQAHNLESELESWGVSVPGVIGQEQKASGVKQPPIIEKEAKGQPSAEEKPVWTEELDEDLEVDGDEEVVEPAQEDLEYPDFGNTLEEDSSHQPKSHLVPLDALESDEELEEGSADDDATDPDIRVEGLDELQKEIEDELSPDEFWATDSDDDEEVIIDEGSISGAMENPVIEEEVQASASVMEGPKDGLGETPKASVEQVDIDELAEKIKERLMPALDDWAKKYCEQAVDKVAWEVIPDLAENLIRKEIQEISESVKD